MPHEVLLQVECSARLVQMRLALKTGASTEELRREGMQQFYIPHRKDRHRDRSSKVSQRSLACLDTILG
jgi:hypothetical protein